MLIQNIFSLFSVSEILEKLNRHNLIPLFLLPRPGQRVEQPQWAASCRLFTTSRLF